MIARVVDYKVGLCRSRNDRNDTPVRTIDLTVQCADEPSIKHVFVQFFRKRQESLGFVNTMANNVVATLPIDDFELARELLSGEEPVSFAWMADIESNLVWAELTTADTPLRAHHLEEERRTDPAALVGAAREGAN